MSEFAPWMFLVKIEPGRKPRVCRISPYEVRHWNGSHPTTTRREPRAWRAWAAEAVVAIGNSVDEAYELIWKMNEILDSTRSHERIN